MVPGGLSTSGGRPLRVVVVGHGRSGYLGASERRKREEKKASGDRSNQIAEKQGSEGVVCRLGLSILRESDSGQ